METPAPVTTHSGKPACSTMRAVNASCAPPPTMMPGSASSFLNLAPGLMRCGRLLLSQPDGLRDVTHRPELAVDQLSELRGAPAERCHAFGFHVLFELLALRGLVERLLQDRQAI